MYGLVVTVYWLLFDCLWSLSRTHTSREEKNKKDEVPPRFELGSLGQSVGSAKVFKHGRKSPWARSSQPKFQPVRLKRWTRFFETFPVGSNRSIEFWTEISGNFGWMDRAPFVPTLTRPFPTVKRMLAPDWARKMLCVIVPSRRTASPEFFSCVRDGCCLAILVWFVHRGAIDDSGKHFGCYRRDHSNFHRENSVSDRSQGIVNNIYEGLDRRKFEYML